MGKRDYAKEIERLVRAAQTEANEALATDDYAEAKLVLAGAIRDVREVKRALTEAERGVRAAYQDARLKTRSKGQTVGMFVNSKTRAAIARGRAAEGRQLSANEAAALRPYADAKVVADRAIASLDRAKAQVADGAARAKEAGGSTTVRPGRGAAAPAAAVDRPAPAAAPPAPPATQTPPPPPPHWAPDFTGRHEHRWWDGTAWTEHVSDRGVPSSDPI
ncbi:DUF2510 domain-containing protein [Cellulomonas sp. ICMP 17802]|uniref:DUF2510 domain-containing protein n=1 Tax=Cellulomonas sp. ICMP 17802 TaxID=3239199 RepID=UPI00351B63DC